VIQYHYHTSQEKIEKDTKTNTLSYFAVSDEEEEKVFKIFASMHSEGRWRNTWPTAESSFVPILLPR